MQQIGRRKKELQVESESRSNRAVLSIPKRETLEVLSGRLARKPEIAGTKGEEIVVSAQRRELNYQRANRAAAAVDGGL